jgi:hypothetical protein
LLCITHRGNRTILYIPFIPFISLFCHIIETSDADDLRRLAEFVDTLKPVLAVSEAITKLHRVCQVLYNVARLYVEAKAQQQQDQEMTIVGNDFDMYLSQLGFMPHNVGTGEHAEAGAVPAGAAHHQQVQQQQEHQQQHPVVPHGFAPGVTPPNMAVPQSVQLGDWFSGNRNLMGLMEEDLSQFQPDLWAATSTLGGP